MEPVLALVFWYRVLYGVPDAVLHGDWSLRRVLRTSPHVVPHAYRLVYQYRVRIPAALQGPVRVQYRILYGVPRVVDL